MNWQKLNDTDTYVNLWNKFKGLFHRKKRDDSDTDDEQVDNDEVTLSGDIDEEQQSEQVVYNTAGSENQYRQPQANQMKQIDLGEIFRVCLKRWYLYIIWCGVAFVIACAIILPVPRYYSSTVKLAPELQGSLNGGSLSSLAQQFGVNLGSAKLNSNDAILPDLYPDLMKSADFITQLFPIRVKTVDDSLNTTYYDYLLNHQKKSKLAEKIEDFTSKFQSKEDEDSAIYGAGNGNPYDVDPFRMTKDQYNVCQSIGDKLSCSVDKKNFVISISVQDQDPLIAATMADSVKAHLQKFITKYRTQKAQNDLNYMLKLQDDAKKRYEKARREYADYSDAHQDAVLQEYQSKMEDMENEMQLRYNTYSALATQVQAARAKVREQTPAFTTLQSATVPIKPAGPKRMIFCAVFVIMAFIIVSIYAFATRDRKKKKTVRRYKKKASTTARQEQEDVKEESDNGEAED